MPEKPEAVMLTDAQMRQFITRGYVVLHPDMPSDFHRDVYERIDHLQQTWRPGNNLLPFIPQLQDYFDHPIVRGALTSVLGPDYMMHPHRHPHFNAPHAELGGWHRDSYWGYSNKVRNHHPWWAMIMYYPQDVLMENGPTGVLGGSHYRETGPAKQDDMSGSASIAAVTGKAGTCFLIHYDIWHAAMPNPSDRRRFMFKFEFARMQRPAGITWNGTSPSWIEPDIKDLDCTHRTMWAHHWNWLKGDGSGTNGTGVTSDGNSIGKWIDLLRRGEDRQRMTAADELGLIGPTAGDAIAPLIDALVDEFEPVGLNAAYALAAIGADATPAVSDALHRLDNGETNRGQRHAAYALSNLGEAALPHLLELIQNDRPFVRGHAAYALGELTVASDESISALTGAANDASAWVRLCAIEALGYRGEKANSAVPVLADLMGDDDHEVRSNAVLSLARLGPAAADATEALAQELTSNDDRYVRGYAVEALHRIGTPQALEALLQHLKVMRWCPASGPDSQF